MCKLIKIIVISIILFVGNLSIAAESQYVLNSIEKSSTENKNIDKKNSLKSIQDPKTVEMIQLKNIVKIDSSKEQEEKEEPTYKLPKEVYDLPTGKIYQKAINI